MFQSSLHRSLLVLLLFSLSVSLAEDESAVDFKVTVDYSRFSIEGGVYLDIYLMIPQSVFTYVKGEGGLEAQVIYQTALVKGDIVPYDPDQWSRTYHVSDRASIDAMPWVPDISKFYVEPGDYILQIDIVDVHSKRQQTIKKPVSLELFPGDKLILSDLTLASQIVKAKTENEFTKYGYDIVPNAQRTYTATAPMMYYFFETYSLSGKGDYSIHPQVISLNDEIVQDFPTRTKKMPGTSSVEWGGVNTAGLGSGIYKLSVDVTDEVSKISTNQKRTFYILRNTGKQQNASQSGDEYADLTPAQIDDIYKVVSIIMDKNEKRLYKKSDDMGKRSVLSSFWDRRDPDPETPDNEFKREFYKRVQIANRDFGSDSEEGWSTDRGRILIKYGPPSSIDRQQSSMGERPWIVWEYYEIEGGVQFIFVDKIGFGAFQLVHSDARSEIQDPDWKRFLK